MLCPDPTVMLLISHNKRFLMYVKVKVHREKLRHVSFQGFEAVKMMRDVSVKRCLGAVAMHLT